MKDIILDFLEGAVLPLVRKYWWLILIGFLLGIIAGAAFGASTVTEGPTVRINGSTIEKAYTSPGAAACRAELATLTVTGKRFCRTEFALKPVASPPAVVWTKVCAEDAAITLSRSAPFRYGAAGQFKFKTLPAGPNKCDNATFGDPIEGTVKVGETTDPGAIVLPPPDMTPHHDMPPVVIPPPTPVPAPQGLRIAPTAAIADPSDGSGAFRIKARHSHFAKDDPLVMPGEPEASHLHDFIGNTSVNAFSTQDTLAAATSTSMEVGGTANRSAYWIPALLDANNVARPVNEALIYYKGGYGLGNKQSLVFPPVGLRTVTGDPTNSVVQPDPQYHWECNGQHVGFQVPKNCNGDLMVTISFNQCWDGRLDSGNHRDHLIRLWNPQCPAGFKPIPEVTINAHWNVTGDLTNWHLSCDMDPAKGGLCMHADMWLNWSNDSSGKNIAEVFTERCIKANKDCSHHQPIPGFGGDSQTLLGDGRYLH